MATQSNRLLTILIVDDEEDLRDMLSLCLKGMLPCEISFALNGDDAIKILENEQIDLVICDYNMPIKNGGAVYQFILESKNPCRYVLCSSDRPDQYPEFSDLSSLYGYLQKPHLLKGLKILIDKIKSEIPQTNEIDTQSYIPVSINFLMRLSIMPSEVFIKLNDGKYVKVFHQDQVFDEVDFAKYSQKEVPTLYFFDLEMNKVFEGIEKTINAISKRSELAPVDIKLKIHGILISTFKEYGLTESFIPFVEEKINETVEMYMKDKNLSVLMNKILRLNDSYLGTHSFLLAAVTVIMATKLNWVSDGPNAKLVISSLMHDVFLKEDTSNEGELLHEKIFDEDFLSHPKKAAELINKIPSLPSDIGRIILEQHEIGEAFGIPHGIHMNRVSALGALFSFCHYLVDFLIVEHRSGKVSVESIYQKMEGVSKNSSHYVKYLKLMKETEIFSQQD